MATFKRFEEIESWKRARKLTNRVYEVSKQGRHFALKDQVRRACVSIMSNIAEGHDRSGTGEFVQFLATAKSSGAEVRQLYIAFDQGYVDENEFVELGRTALETQSLIGGLMNYLRRSGYKSNKYRPVPSDEVRTSRHHD